MRPRTSRPRPPDAAGPPLAAALAWPVVAWGRVAASPGPRRAALAVDGGVRLAWSRPGPPTSESTLDEMGRLVARPALPCRPRPRRRPRRAARTRRTYAPGRAAAGAARVLRALPPRACSARTRGRLDARAPQRGHALDANHCRLVVTGRISENGGRRPIRPPGAVARTGANHPPRKARRSRHVVGVRRVRHPQARTRCSTSLPRHRGRPPAARGLAVRSGRQQPRQDEPATARVGPREDSDRVRM